MPGGDSMDARETSIVEGFLGVSEAMFGRNATLGRHLSSRGITVVGRSIARGGYRGISTEYGGVLIACGTWWPEA
jgi:hypothetical protein